MNEMELQKRIAETAYYRAERRRFAGNRALDDWLEAEREVAASDYADAIGSTAEPTQADGAEVPAPLRIVLEIQQAEAKVSSEEIVDALQATASTRAVPTAGGRTKANRSSAPGVESP